MHVRVTSAIVLSEANLVLDLEVETVFVMPMPDDYDID